MVRPRSSKKGKTANNKPNDELTDFWVKNNPGFHEILVSHVKPWSEEPLSLKKDYVLEKVIPALNSCAEENGYAIHFDPDVEKDRKVCSLQLLANAIVDEGGFAESGRMD